MAKCKKHNIELEMGHYFGSFEIPICLECLKEVVEKIWPKKERKASNA